MPSMRSSAEIALAAAPVDAGNSVVAAVLQQQVDRWSAGFGCGGDGVAKDVGVVGAQVNGEQRQPLRQSGAKRRTVPEHLAQLASLANAQAERVHEVGRLPVCVSHLRVVALLVGERHAPASARQALEGGFASQCVKTPAQEGGPVEGLHLVQRRDHICEVVQHRRDATGFHTEEGMCEIIERTRPARSLANAGIDVEPDLSALPCVVIVLEAVAQLVPLDRQLAPAHDLVVGGVLHASATVGQGLLVSPGHRACEAPANLFCVIMPERAASTSPQYCVCPS